jgi:uncharacterized protein YjeT (DUF2065 family)
VFVAGRARDWGEFTESALVKVVEGLSPSLGPPALLHIYERHAYYSPAAALVALHRSHLRACGCGCACVRAVMRGQNARQGCEDE